MNKKNKRFLVTSALPYANGQIHLGHLVEYIQTDIWVRFQKLIGNDCIYMCADDAHGTAVMLSAKEKNVSPEDFIEGVRQEHLRDFTGFFIEFDKYHSTHSEENKVFSEEIYNKAVESGLIKKEAIEQFFDEEKGLFLADRYVKGICPYCGAEDQYGDACEKCFKTYNATQLKNPVSQYSGKAPILKTSDHYFFQLHKCQDQIKAWLDTNPVSKEVRNKLNEWLESDLKDWDISRDAPYFGFKIPGTEDKYFYVWLDAPIGYIAATEKWCKEHNRNIDEFWKNPDVEIHHFIGKDILYFHTLFWPAMLNVGGFQQPKHVHIHGFLTVNGEKMSKSRGTFILASKYLEKLNPEFLRYYYAAKLSNTLDDIDFNLDDFVVKVNSDVLGKVINIGSRLGSILYKKCDARMTSLDEQGALICDQIVEKKADIELAYQNREFNKAMRHIMGLADTVNKYIDENAPWAVVKEDKDKAAEICTSGLNALRLLMIYLKPVLPEISKGLESFLNINALTWSCLDSRLCDHEINKYQHLAGRLAPEDVEYLINT